MEWVRFLDENNIPYVTRGPNTKRGEVSIACPYCGDDPSEHLGINLSSDAWGCLRNQSHRGKSARYLVKALLRCSSQQAYNTVRQYSHSDPDTLEAILKEFDGEETNAFKVMERQARTDVQFGDFSPIMKRGTTRRFWSYLNDRCYGPIASARRYGLRCAKTGRYKDRIIIPVIHNEEMIGWTARAINKTATAPRYLASNEEIKTVVWNYDQIKKGGRRLFITEGPFDAIKLDSYFRQSEYGLGVFATCTFGTSVTLPQVAILRSLVSKFDQTFVLFDRGADEQGDQLKQWLAHGAQQAFLPDDDRVDDPGDLNERQLDQLLNDSFDGFIDSWPRRYTNWMGNLVVTNKHPLGKV